MHSRVVWCVVAAMVAASLTVVLVPGHPVRASVGGDGRGAAVYVVNMAGAVYKLDGQTGAALWQYPLPPEFHGTALQIVAGEERCILLTRKLLVVLDSRDGTELWRVGEPDNSYLEDMVAAGDRVYVRQSRLNPDWTSSEEISALDPSGSIVWTSSVPLSGDHFAVLDGAVYVSDHLRRSPGVALVALDAATGALRWRAPINPAPMPGTLILHRGMLYGTSDWDVRHPNHVAALSERTGDVRWDQPAPANHRWGRGELRAEGDAVYANLRPMSEIPGTTGPGDFVIQAWDARSGAARWTSAPGYWFLTGTPLVNRSLLASSMMKTIEGLDPESGGTVWRAATCPSGGCIQDWWGVVDDRVAVVQDVGRGQMDLLSIDLDSHDVVRRQRLNRLAPPPWAFWGAQAGGMLYLVTADAARHEFMQAVDIHSGSELWAQPGISTGPPDPAVAA